MTKNFITIILLLSNILLFSQKETELAYNLKIGDKFLFETELNSSIEQEIMGTSTSVIQTFILDFTFELFNLPNDSTIQAYLQYIRIKTKNKGPGINESDSIDSRHINLLDSVDFKRITELLNDTLIVTLNRNGKITDLSQIINSDSIRKLQNDDIYEKMRALYSRYALFHSFTVLNFPDKKLIIGESWLNSDTIKQITFFLHSNNYTLDSISNEEYKISYKSSVASNSNTNFDVGNTFLNYDVAGEMTGKLYLYKNSCLIKRAKYIQTVAGKTIMKYSKDSDAEYTWPIRIINNIIVKSKKVNNAK